jgi:A/G-specific adenine glycosylase
MNILKQQFSSAIILWQMQHGRHHLPWQQQGPYATWISEIMLQQTQVITVIDYFKRFMQRFPTLHDLAHAPVDDVLSLWAGLGYYARARNLHQCAKMIIKDFHGVFPNTLTALTTLPGIGPSTAGAILALGHQQHGVILDGNVKRILARCFGLHGDTQSSFSMKQLWRISHHLTPIKDCHIYTQGMMDLGATICHKSAPSCGLCPVQNICYAHKHNVIQHLPYKKLKKNKPTFEKTMYFFVNKDRVGLNKQSEKGIWHGLWVPIIQTGHNHQEQTACTHYPIFKHVFTHQTWLIKPIVIYTCNPDIQDWFSYQDALQLGIPKPVKDILEMIQHDQKNSLQKTRTAETCA